MEYARSGAFDAQRSDDLGVESLTAIYRQLTNRFLYLPTATWRLDSPQLRNDYQTGAALIACPDILNISKRNTRANSSLPEFSARLSPT
jgi:hypothetical protein